MLIDNIKDEENEEDCDMNKILKYKLENIDQQTLEISLPATILSVLEMNDDIILYSLVDDGKDVPKISVDILVIGTGEVVEDNIGMYTFLGTVKLFDNKEIWHVFYRFHDHIVGESDRLPVIEELNEKIPGIGGILV